ncbi:ATP-binding domain-containing protein [Hazenella sp. IB182353]|uniref:RNA polymerase recycling motor HelD n=1 Tax=Polycladospora coralii TaxID=2771432 RepID=UPI001746A9E0|nr:RNA polymerase recycling motor HelD [Polycladospora coralii]MBS7529375.1 ATP-binding domain-containing protein [Polycladospora coralii]
MTLSHFDKLKEQQRIKDVMIEITKRLQRITQKTSVLQQDIVEIRKTFWDQVTINLDDTDEAIETLASLNQQAGVLSERERTHRHTAKEMKVLKQLKRSPYFGRVDFCEENQKKAEEVYVGLASLLDHQETHFLIYDWRSPIASLFYDSEIGETEYQALDRKFRGEVQGKRQYLIKNGVLKHVFETRLTIRDERLQTVLGKQADTNMRSIVATIQKEQNAIIRDERSRMLMVQGVAGSGKTSVVMQRIAYLLYRYRKGLNADQIVLFSPNLLFSQYIREVLPELGEENMQQTTYQVYLNRTLPADIRVESGYDQLEFALTGVRDPHYKTRMAGIQYKGTPNFMRFIDCYVEELGNRGMIFSDILFQGRALFTAQDIQKLFDQTDLQLRLKNRMQLLSQLLLQELYRLQEEMKKEAWVESAVELLDKAVYQQVYQELEKKEYRQGDQDDFEAEYNQLASYVVKRELKPIKHVIQKLSFVDVWETYNQLFQYNRTPEELDCSVWREICVDTRQRLQAFLPYEDATSFLYLFASIHGYQTNTSIRHVFIDEVQDYTPFQLYMIKKMFPFSKMTVVGDFNQALHGLTQSAVDLASFTSLYGENQTSIFSLKKSYRSTGPIMLFAREIVEDDTIEPFHRDGKVPTITKAQDSRSYLEKMIGCIKKLQQQHQTIAIICKTANESKAIFSLLQAHIQMTRIEEKNESFDQGVLAIPIYLAKGIEFDAVIVHDVSSIQFSRPEERKWLYVACTRAMHELHLLYEGELTPFITQIPSDKYLHIQ